MEPPLCTNGSAGYLMQLSVKTRRQPGGNFCSEVNIARG